MHFTRRGLLRAGTAGVLSSALQACGGGGASAESGDGADSQDHSVGSVPVVPSGGIAGRVVIVGGGMAGATLAKYLRLWGGTRMDVTLVEREPQYTSNIMSSLVLSGQRTIDSLHYRYDTLRSAYGW